VEIKSMTRKNPFVSGAAIGASAMLLAGAAGYIAHAQGPAGPVNPPGRQLSQGSPGSFADIVAKVAPAVVSINVTEKSQLASAAMSDPSQAWPFGKDSPFGFQFMIPQTPGGQGGQPVKASGSGFFISPDGYIVTNNHVVQGAQKISVVTNDNRTLTAHVVGADPATDLAVIKVDGGPFRYVSFEDRGQPRVGDWVVAVGNPFGLGGTATAGIVSALGRANVSGSSYVDYMQIDAPINHGNSGGPTFDVDGRVVGVNTAIFSPSGGSVGIGFDIPADVAAQVTQQLIANGQVTRGYIGATIQSVSPELAESLGLHNVKGALVDQLTPGGPADRAGLRSGDVITSVDGDVVASSSDLTRKVALTHPGDAVRLTVLRDGAPREFTLTSGRRPSEQALAQNGQDGGQSPDGAPSLLGLQLAPDPDGGLLVQGVSPNSDAADKGVQQGDVILRAGLRRVESSADLSAAVTAAEAAGRTSVPLLVARAGQRFYVPLALKPAARG
jgi:serine protease Do